MTGAERKRTKLRDYTEAMTRPHKVTRYGPGPNDKLPGRIQPTNQQTMIAMGLVIGVGVLAWQYALSGRVPLFSWWSWLPLWVAVTAVVAPLWHKKPFDERNLARSLQSIGGHRVASRGHAAGPWTVHGEAHRNTRRRPKRPDVTFIPAREASS